jgi:hypothetical protein
MTDMNRSIYSASSTLSLAVMVTDEMVIEASKAGDMEQLRLWARQGVRVTTGGALCAAADDGFLEVTKCLMLELGADVNQTLYHGWTPLLVGASCGRPCKNCALLGRSRRRREQRYQRYK